MRNGFTLIELMIVIAIIAIIAAIAIPNLMESRISSNENAASSTLKSGISAAQAQFQSSLYSDSASKIVYGYPNHGADQMPSNASGDGRGDFAGCFNQLAGGIAAFGTPQTAPASSDVRVNFLPRQWTDITAANFGGQTYQTQQPAGGSVVAGPVNSSYIFAIASFSEGFVVVAAPTLADGSAGRRLFAINHMGAVYATLPQTTAANLAMPTATVPFGATIPFVTPAVGATPPWRPLR